jgi:hypothetical protein
MHKDKIKNILNLSSEERYEYSIREIVKLEKIWAVATADSWVMIADESGDEVFPIWPHQEVAELCILEELKVTGYFIKPIELNSFLKYCIPDMEENDILFGVFYNEKKEALAITPDKLKTDLDEEYNG